MTRELKHRDTVAARLRFDKFLRLLSPYNEKTPKGEKHGYLQAILYLSPHTLVSPKTLCPHSTEACRAGCLYTAGRGQTPRVDNARRVRTEDYVENRTEFIRELAAELRHMQRIADDNDMRLAIRLNGTSDIRWELEKLGAFTLFDLLPEARFFDYTRTPIHHRPVPDNWHLTWSLADAPLREAVHHLLNGQSVAAVVPKGDVPQGLTTIALRDRVVPVIDGDEHDLRFLDPPGALVLLKPKGVLRRGGPMVRPNLIHDLNNLAKELT